MIALYCLIAVMFLPIILSIGSIPFRFQQESGPNIYQPREQAARLKGAGARITHAQNNSWEALILFSTTLLLVFLSGTDLNDVALPCLIFVGIRLMYIGFYMANFGWARFISFLSGASVLVWMLITALGNAQ